MVGKQTKILSRKNDKVQAKQARWAGQAEWTS